MADSVDPKSSKTTGCHIFVEPAGAIAEELQEIINRLAAENGSPAFRPHITVLARIREWDEEEVLRKAEELAASTEPVTLTLGELMSEEVFYRTLYSRIHEQDILRSWYEKACGMFGIEKDPAYLAHLSLLYGNYSPEHIAQIRSSLVMPEEKTFIADRLHVYRTEGEVGQWYKIGEFPFK